MASTTSTDSGTKSVIREKINTDTIPLETNEKILSDVTAFYAAKDYGKLARA